MRTQKGICIEHGGDRSVYLLADGRFMAGTPKGEAVVGAEGYFEPDAPKLAEKRRRKIFVLPAMAAVAALFLAISSFMLPAQEAYSYVQIETNPGIELGLDSEHNVISTRGLNEDGRLLIEQLDRWEDESLETVLKQVLSLSVDDETKHVTITAVHENDDTKTLRAIEQASFAALIAGRDQSLQVHLKEANKEQWRKSKREQVPVARYAVDNRILTKPLKQDNEVQPAKNEERGKKSPEKESPPPQGQPAEKKPAKSPIPASPPSTAPKGNGPSDGKQHPETPAVKQEQPKPASPSNRPPEKPATGSDKKPSSNVNPSGKSQQPKDVKKAQPENAKNNAKNDGNKSNNGSGGGTQPSGDSQSPAGKEKGQPSHSPPKGQGNGSGPSSTPKPDKGPGAEANGKPPAANKPAAEKGPASRGKNGNNDR